MLQNYRVTGFTVCELFKENQQGQEVTCDGRSMQKQPHLIILSQKINTNTKSPTLITQLVL